MTRPRPQSVAGSGETDFSSTIDRLRLPRDQDQAWAAHSLVAEQLDQVHGIHSDRALKFDQKLWRERVHRGRIQAPQVDNAAASRPIEVELLEQLRQLCPVGRRDLEAVGGPLL